MYVWCNSDSNSDDGDSKRKQADCFEPSVCFGKMRNDLSFKRFCLRCKQTFLRYFTQKLHVIEKNTFFQFKVEKMEKLTSIKVFDCFFDVGIYCLSEDLPYANFFIYVYNQKMTKEILL